MTRVWRGSAGVSGHAMGDVVGQRWSSWRVLEHASGPHGVRKCQKRPIYMAKEAS
jgi:hypothetical protein